MRFGFGQPADGVVQTAFVVPDLAAAIDRYVSDLNVGPWFVLDRLEADGAAYRGAPSSQAVTLAMAFAGHMQIELIEPLNDAPSIYKEVIDTRGHGFHHLGVATTDLEAATARYLDRGYEIAFRSGVPTGGEIRFFDTKGELPGFIELFEATDAVDALFTSFYVASVGWDGADPIRPFL